VYLWLCVLVQAKNSKMLVECFYSLEDFLSLGRLMEALPEGNALLRSIGEKFQSVGLCNEGVSAFLKVSWQDYHAL
jgi:WD repeat-containing protein 35